MIDFLCVFWTDHWILGSIVLSFRESQKPDQLFLVETQKKTVVNLYVSTALLRPGDLAIGRYFSRAPKKDGEIFQGSSHDMPIFGGESNNAANL